MNFLGLESWRSDFNMKSFCFLILFWGHFTFINEVFGQDRQAQKPILLRAVVLVDREDSLIHNVDELSDLEGLHNRCTFFPGSLGLLEKKLFKALEAKQLNAKCIQEVKHAIHQYYIESQFPLVTLRVPPQRVHEGVLQIIVECSRIGKIEVEGNQWTSREKIASMLRMKSGERVDQGKILKSINSMNKNTFRQIDVQYAPGELSGTTDLELIVKENSPWRVYTGIENTGTQSTGKDRFFSGASWGNAWGRGDVVTAQYTASLNFYTLQTATLHYQMFFEKQTALNCWFGYSSVYANLHEKKMKSHGQFYQVSSRYSFPLPPTLSRTQEIHIGFDVKSTNNTLVFVEADPVFSKWVNLTQLVLGYSLEKNTEVSVDSFKANLTTSLGPWLPHQSNPEFSSMRHAAKNHWIFLTAEWNRTLSLPNRFTLYASGQLQWASQTLLPSEQLGIGGARSVRGYEERVFNADSGMIGSGEIWFPSFSIFGTRQNSRFKDALQLIGFLDFGYGRNHVVVQPSEKQQALIGIGPGFRYSLGSYISVRCDWGVQLHHRSMFSGFGNQLHFSAVASY